MYQTQQSQFHTSNYRGNQQGHDAYLRSDSQFPTTYSTNQNVTSQYRGFQKPYQPTGIVQSVYGHNTSVGLNQSNSAFNQSNAGMINSTFNSNLGTQNYHTANYRGNQPGHDSYLRSDSRQPSQFSGVSNLNQTSFTPSYSTYNTGISNTGVGVSSFNQNQLQNQNQFVSPDSYHTANYKGNQQGHDSYLRSDSNQPSLSKMGISSSGTGFGHTNVSNFSSINNNINATTLGGSTLGTTLGLNQSNLSSFNQNQNLNQFVSPESYHTANYKGNQQGHDNYLRADSVQPSQSQFGIGSTNSLGIYNTTNRY